MTQLTFRDAVIDMQPGETVLSALLRAEIEAPHSCRAGVCQTCLHRAVEGKPTAAAQAGLTEAQKALGYFLACVCVPDAPLAIVPTDEAGEHCEATVRAIDRLSGDVVRLHLEHGPDFTYRPGQFLELITPEGFSRHYSIASLPEDASGVELHIRLHQGGAMSGFVSERLSVGDRLHVAGPRGTCFYEGLDSDQPITLVGAGTGLAPLLGILRDALRRGHRGPIRLYHGARTRAGLYLHDHLEELAAARDNVAYIPRTLADASGDIAETVLEQETALAQTAFFLCGGEGLVSRLKRALFMKGASLRQIRSDVFLPAQ